MEQTHTSVSWILRFQECPSLPSVFVGLICQELFVRYPFFDCYILSFCLLLLSLLVHFRFHLVGNHEGPWSSVSPTVSPLYFGSASGVSSLIDDFGDINT